MSDDNRLYCILSWKKSLTSRCTRNIYFMFKVRCLICSILPTLPCTNFLLVQVSYLATFTLCLMLNVIYALSKESTRLLSEEAHNSWGKQMAQAGNVLFQACMRCRGKPITSLVAKHIANKGHVAAKWQCSSKCMKTNIVAYNFLKVLSSVLY